MRRPVRLCVPFVLGAATGVYRKKPSDDCERRFEIVPEVPDPKQLYLESLAATTWRNTPEIWRCFEQGPKERVRVKWVLASSGLVAHVEVLTKLGPALRSCIDRTIIRWVFPAPVAGVARLVLHEFDPELSAVRR